MRWVWLAVAAVAVAGCAAQPAPVAAPREPDPVVERRGGPTAEEEAGLLARVGGRRKPPRREAPAVREETPRKADRDRRAPAPGPVRSPNVARPQAGAVSAGRARGVPPAPSRLEPPRASDRTGREAPPTGAGERTPQAQADAPASPPEAGHAEPQTTVPPATQAPVGQPEPAHIPELTPPRPVFGPLPDYPGMRLVVHAGNSPSAASLGPPEGRVRLRLLVRSDGTVGSVEVVVSSGDPEVDRAAVDALSRWRFEPARRDGGPIDSYYFVWVTFQLRGP